MTYGPGVAGSGGRPEPVVRAAPAFVARGKGGGIHPGNDAKLLSLLGALIVLELVSLVFSMVPALHDWAGPGAARTTPVDVIVLLAIVAGRGWWRFRAERQLADTELWMSPYGAGYRCAAGYFEVPWSAVRWIGYDTRVGGAPTATLRIQSDEWLGPVQTLSYRWFDWNVFSARTNRRSGPRALRLDLSHVDRGAVARAAYAATEGRIRLDSEG